MNVLSEKEETKKAIRWMSEKLEEHPDEPLHKLMDKAIFKFDLSPAEAEFILRFFNERAAKH